MPSKLALALALSPVHCCVRKKNAQARSDASKKAGTH